MIYSQDFIADIASCPVSIPNYVRSFHLNRAWKTPTSRLPTPIRIRAFRGLGLFLAASTGHKCTSSSLPIVPPFLVAIVLACAPIAPSSCFRKPITGDKHVSRHLRFGLGESFTRSLKSSTLFGRRTLLDPSAKSLSIL